MTAKRDLYASLGLKRGATLEEIKKQFYKLSFKYHPDKHRGSQYHANHDRFNEILEAYQILKDPKRRAAYDESFQNVKVKYNAKENWERWSRGRYIEPDPLRHDHQKEESKKEEDRITYIRVVALTTGIIGYFFAVFKEVKRDAKK